MLNIAHTCITEEVNGPGRRFTVWVQGCPRRCPGCFNPGLRPFDPRREVSPGELSREAWRNAPLDGVSLSGGEPFAQAAELSAFLDAVRSEAGGGRLDVLAFTGYRVEELREGPPEAGALLERLDLVVDGPFLAEQACESPLRGSSNQRLIAMTPAGEALKRRVERGATGGFGVTVTSGGDVILTGFPPADLQRLFRGALTEGPGGLQG